MVRKEEIKYLKATNWTKRILVACRFCRVRLPNWSINWVQETCKIRLFPTNRC